jgi:hypothetical protein
MLSIHGKFSLFAKFSHDVFTAFIWQLYVLCMALMFYVYGSSMLFVWQLSFSINLELWFHILFFFSCISIVARVKILYFVLCILLIMYSFIVFSFFSCPTYNGYDINAQCSCSKVYCIFFFQSSSEGDCCITRFISKH